MRFKIKKCTQCQRYTLKDACPQCGSNTKNPQPAKFSLKDPYGKYRRLMKKQHKTIEAATNERNH